MFLPSPVFKNAKGKIQLSPDNAEDIEYQLTINHLSNGVYISYDGEDDSFLCELEILEILDLVDQ